MPAQNSPARDRLTPDDIRAIFSQLPPHPKGWSVSFLTDHSGGVEIGILADAGEARFNISISRQGARVVVRDVAAGGKEIAAYSDVAAVMSELGFVVRGATGYWDGRGDEA